MAVEMVLCETNAHVVCGEDYKREQKHVADCWPGHCWLQKKTNAKEKQGRENGHKHGPPPGHLALKRHGRNLDAPAQLLRRVPGLWSRVLVRKPIAFAALLSRERSPKTALVAEFWPKHLYVADDRDRE